MSVGEIPRFGITRRFFVDFSYGTYSFQIIKRDLIEICEKEFFCTFIEIKKCWVYSFTHMKVTTNYFVNIHLSYNYGKLKCFRSWDLVEGFALQSVLWEGESEVFSYSDSPSFVTLNKKNP